jgi:hypothetical protein
MAKKQSLQRKFFVDGVGGWSHHHGEDEALPLPAV